MLRVNKKLEKAIESCIRYSSIEELKEHFKWYKVENIEELSNVMYESYLDNYSGKELEYRIKLLGGENENI